MRFARKLGGVLRTPLGARDAARRRSNRRPSFVLVDALVAAVLLGISLTAILSMVNNALRSQREGERLEVVAMLLDEQLSMIVARGPDTYVQRFGGRGRCDAPYQDYEYEVDISGGNGEAFFVDVTISWVVGGKQRSEHVQTRIAPHLGDDPDPDRKPEESVLRL